MGIEDNAALITRLAALRGIADSWLDFKCEPQQVSLATKAGILRAMGLDPGDAAALAAGVAEAEAAQWRELLPPAMVALEGEAAGIAANVPREALEAPRLWRLVTEQGARLEGRVAPAACPEVAAGGHAGVAVSRRQLPLPAGLPAGYHEYTLEGAPGPCRVIVAPPACHEPAALTGGRRLWGVAVQLYTLRSERNWGIGDFADLEAVVRGCAAAGADFVGLNPLHALFPARPANCSPYSASSRHALNVLYIAIERVAEFEGCREARERVADAAFQQRLAALRAAPLVDYPGVAAAKLGVLELLFTQFRRARSAAGRARREEFATWRAERGEALALHALYDALDEHFTQHGHHGWQSWPQPFRDPRSAEVAAFARKSAARVDYYAWLQWLADGQLAALRRLCGQLGMAIGLYGDYAVGVNPDGSETWADQAVYRLGAGVGAPPDALALKGQDWGIPPQDPNTLARRGYAPFVALLRANMRHFGALRLDHVMALVRQWWVPQGLGARDGGYVRYPLAELVAIVALESRRAGCLIVGEDLGTVPPEMGEAMARFRLYHYKVVLFEQDDAGFKAPEAYVANAIATISTHDLPTLRSWWDAGDVALRERLHLYPDAATRDQVVAARGRDRERLLDALAAAGIRPRWPVERYEPAFAAAIHRFLGRTAAALAVVQAEDLLGMSEPVNVPGTSAEYPNWRRKLSGDLGALLTGAEAAPILAALAAERGSAGEAP